MKSLAEHEAEFESAYDPNVSNEPTLNGISCPRCGQEMWDTRPRFTVSTKIPKKAIHCTCGYRGYRTA